jgi:hypothetical protein
MIILCSCLNENEEIVSLDQNLELRAQNFDCYRKGKEVIEGTEEWAQYCAGSEGKWCCRIKFQEQCCLWKASVPPIKYAIGADTVSATLSSIDSSFVSNDTMLIIDF